MLKQWSRIVARLSLALLLLSVWQPQTVAAMSGDGSGRSALCDNQCKFCDQGCIASCAVTVPFPHPEAEFSGPLRLAEPLHFCFARRATVGIDRTPDTGPPRRLA